MSHYSDAATFRAAIVALLAMAALPACAHADALSCLTPVHAGEGAKSILARWRGHARITDLPEDENGSVRGLMLFGSEPRKRLTIRFDNEELTRVSSVSIDESASVWKAGGVRIGSSLADVEAANGAPFIVYGWSSDIGGFAVFSMGKLADVSFGCHVSVRFEPPKGIKTPGKLEGERPFESANVDLRALDPVVSQLGLDFIPAPEAKRP